MRRLVALFLVWAALPAFAAELGSVRPVPLQLSLPFAAVPAAIAPSLSLLAPSPALALSAAPISQAAPAAAAPSAALAPAIPAEVLRAFRSGDAQAYLDAARRADYDPPDTDDAQTALYREGLDREAADRAFFAAASPASVAKAARRARATKLDYEEFGRQLARRPGVSSDIFRDAGAKRAILRAAGYDALIGSGGRRIKLEDASDARVGRAFQNVLKSFERR